MMNLQICSEQQFLPVSVLSYAILDSRQLVDSLSANNHLSRFTVTLPVGISQAYAVKSKLVRFSSIVIRRPTFFLSLAFSKICQTTLVKVETLPDTAKKNQGGIPGHRWNVYKKNQKISNTRLEFPLSRLHLPGSPWLGRVYLFTNSEPNLYFQV